ncbi:hypothetical protein BYT27DRAFT_7252726 [Phlegmacium glaucopus]|nr:hypothetical protein BYT27DRAFT_7252726 [Phlegmacium glaucopus]
MVPFKGKTVQWFFSSSVSTMSLFLISIALLAVMYIIYDKMRRDHEAIIKEVKVPRANGQRT